MIRYCVNLDCSEHQSHHLKRPKLTRVVRKGSYYRRCDRRYIQRFKCKACHIQFSRATFDPDFRQRRREINDRLYELLCSGVSQRRSAILLKTDRMTIQRKFNILAERARLDHGEWVEERFKGVKIEQVQFDDLETSEHTKCKPLSVTLAVHKDTREILCFQVKRMPARGTLAPIARRKYGNRKDERAEGWNHLFKTLKDLVHEKAFFESDENPHYPKQVKRHFPDSTHIQYKGARGAIVGQGELKKLKFDPLFSLNHTCAMLRANLNRLFRRTWCTTKKLEGLERHLWLYVKYHNLELIGQPLEPVPIQ